MYMYIYIYIYIHTHIHTCMLSRFSHVLLFETPWTVAHKASLSMGFSRQEYWSGLPCPSPCIHIHIHIYVYIHIHTHTRTSIRISQFWTYDMLLISNFVLLIILVTSIFVKNAYIYFSLYFPITFLDTNYMWYGITRHKMWKFCLIPLSTFRVLLYPK